MKETTKEKLKKLWCLYPLVVGLVCTYVIWLILFFDMIFNGDGKATIYFTRFHERDIEFVMLSIGMFGFIYRFYKELQSKAIAIYITLVLLVFIIITWLV